MKSILEPLAIAANITQGNSTRLDSVLLCLGNLYRMYSQPAFMEQEPEISRVLLESLEKRWGKCDQEIFILAVFLNPYVRDAAFSSSRALSRHGLLGLAIRAFKRFNRTTSEPEPGFTKAFIDYFNQQGSFSVESMCLKAATATAESQVGPIPQANLSSLLTCYSIGRSSRHGRDLELHDHQGR